MGAIRWVGILLGRNFLGGEYPGWKFSGWELSDRNHPGGNFASGSFHVTLKTLILIYIYIYIFVFPGLVTISILHTEKLRCCRNKTS